jgi:hypothetical protein
VLGHYGVLPEPHLHPQGRSDIQAALVEDYKSMQSGIQADFVTRTQVLSLTVVERLQEAVEDEDKPLSPGVLLEIGKFAADRTGNAPVQKNVNLNVNADLGSKLDAARRRLAAAQPVQITEVPGGGANDPPPD